MQQRKGTKRGRRRKGSRERSEHKGNTRQTQGGGATLANTNLRQRSMTKTQVQPRRIWAPVSGLGLAQRLRRHTVKAVIPSNGSVQALRASKSLTKRNAKPLTHSDEMRLPECHELFLGGHQNTLKNH